MADVFMRYGHDSPSGFWRAVTLKFSVSIGRADGITEDDSKSNVVGWTARCLAEKTSIPIAKTSTIHHVVASRIGCVTDCVRNARTPESLPQRFIKRHWIG